MPAASLLAWLFTRSLLLPHEPATMSLAPPGEFGASPSVAGLVETTIAAVTSDRFDASGTGTGIAPKIGAYRRVVDVHDVSPRRSRHHQSAQARHAARAARHGGPRQFFDHDRAQSGRDERDGHAARSRAAAARQLAVVHVSRHLQSAGVVRVALDAAVDRDAAIARGRELRVQRAGGGRPCRRGDFRAADAHDAARARPGPGTGSDARIVHRALRDHAAGARRSASARRLPTGRPPERRVDSARQRRRAPATRSRSFRPRGSAAIPITLRGAWPAACSTRFSIRPRRP